jgi:20S proteasome alpha/beta subunit
MTVLVGVRCSNGIVIGTDSAVTYAPVPDPQHFTAEVSQGLKIYNVGTDVIAAITGEVGLGQRFAHMLQNVLTNPIPVDNKPTRLRTLPTVQVGTIISQVALGEFKRTRQDWERQIGLGALLAIVLEDKPRLIWFDGVYFRPELVGEQDEKGAFRTLPLITAGSGQKLADPFLFHSHRVLFGEQHFPSTADGRLLVACTLDHVIRYNTGAVGGNPHVASLELDGKNWVIRQSLDDEVRQQIQDLEVHMRAYCKAPAEAPNLNDALGQPAPAANTAA